MSGLAGCSGWRAGWLVRRGLPAGVLIVAAFVRLYDLGGESLWLDEGFTRQVACRPLPELFRAVLQYDYNPPAYYLFARLSLLALGPTETALRLPAALFSIAGIVLFYRIAIRLAPPVAARLATALAAVMVFDVRFAQEARAYSLLNCAGALFMLAYLNLADADRTGRPVRRRWALLWLVSGVVLLYSHPYGVFAVAIQNLHWLYRVWARTLLPLKARSWLILQVVLGLLYVPWLARTVAVTRAIQERPTHLRPPGLADVFEVFREIAGWHAGFAVALLVLAGLALLPHRPFGRAGLLRARRGRVGFVAFWLIAAVGLPFAVSHLLTPVFAGRYLISATYPFYLLVALGVCRVPRPAVRTLLALGVIVLAGVALARYYPKVQKEQWRQAVAWLSRQAAPGSTVLFHADYCLYTIYPCYASRDDLVTVAFPRRVFLERPTMESVGQELDRRLPGDGPLWLVYCRGSVDRDRLLLRALRQRLGVPRHTAFKGIDLYYYPGAMPDRAGAWSSSELSTPTQ